MVVLVLVVENTTRELLIERRPRRRAVPAVLADA